MAIITESCGVISMSSDITFSGFVYLVGDISPSARSPRGGISAKLASSRIRATAALTPSLRKARWLWG